ncbi:Arylsulfatase [Pontiella desulfatans]|uniref:Arylsulfatase n=1 Tax=Pontiella desulfatans TaxID=2750659 RepID=A0A6C2TZL9_PONDE|nr:sulfatase [Pontiella desulfatans]SPS73699.1 sulfatase S1_7 [Kiritimatiellales bacterium]VGO12801.1 Arylsulfatase [Pontiella desulfatans]
MRWQPTGDTAFTPKRFAQALGIVVFFVQASVASITLDFNVASTNVGADRLYLGSAPLTFTFTVDGSGHVSLDAATTSGDQINIDTVNGWDGAVGTVADSNLFGTSFTLEANAANSDGNANVTLEGADTGVMAVQGQNSGRIDGATLPAPNIESLDWTLASGHVAIDFISWDWGYGTTSSDMILVDADSTNSFDNMGVSGTAGLSGISLAAGEMVSFTQPPTSGNGVGLAGLSFDVSATGSGTAATSVLVVDASAAFEALASSVESSRTDVVNTDAERRIDWSDAAYLFNGGSPGTRIYGGAVVTSAGDSLLGNNHIWINSAQNDLVVRMDGGAGSSAARAMLLWDSSDFLSPGSSFGFDATTNSSFQVEAGAAYFGPGGTRYVIRDGGTCYLSSLEGITASSGIFSIDGASPGLQWAPFDPAEFATFDTDAADLGLPSLGSFAAMTFDNVTGVGLLCESYRSSFTRLEIRDFEAQLVGTPPDTALPGYGSHPFELIQTEVDPVTGYVTVSWEAALNQRFTVERNSDLANPEWMVLASDYPDGGADGNTVTYVDTTAVSNQNFYRVSRPYDPDKPLNVLLIVVDDLRDHESFSLNNIVQMPNLDRFAAKGVKFNNAFCQATYCNPSRASFLTGLRPESTGILNNEDYFRDSSDPAVADAVTLPQCFRGNGYYTASLGKILHGSQLDPLSWDLQINTFAATPAGNSGEWVNMTADAASPLSWCKWRAPDCADNDLGDGIMAEKAIEILNTKRTDPFFLALGFKKPHDPFDAPKRYFDLYPLTHLVLHADPVDASPLPPQALAVTGGSMIAFNAMDEQDRLEFLRCYAACSTYVDAQIGRVFDAMDELGLWQNTVVMLWTDHGYHQGERGWWNKTLLDTYDAKVPFMAYVPEMPECGVVNTGVVELVDVYPTLADLAGVAPPASLEGDSFAPLLQSPGIPWGEVAITQRTSGSAIVGTSVFDGRYRYTEWTDGNKQLFDHASDPGEWYNLADDPAHAGLMLSLSQHLQ